MQLRRKSKARHLKRATVMVQAIVFGGAVGVGIAALAIDTGLMFSAQQELQNAADSAALAAASQLGEPDGVSGLALQEAIKYAGLNKITGEDADLLSADFVLGHAVMSGAKFDFLPQQEPFDAVRVTVRRDAQVSDGPVSMFFSTMFGSEGASLSASATAMLVPRDIALVIDLSGSMNDDSELRHYTDFWSESGDTRDGVQVNLFDIWAALPIEKGNSGVGNGLDPPPPGHPHSENDQPGTGPGSPANAGGNPSPGADPGEGWARGPRWGWLTGWGEPIVLGSYGPVGDSGLYYIPKGSQTTDADVLENLTTAGYTQDEIAAMLSSAYDYDTTTYRNRVKVLLGLAGWKSKMKIGTEQNSKFTGGPGNGDNRIDSNELCQEIDYPFNSGSWNSYIDYVRSSGTQMKYTDSNFRYRFGLKTFVNYLLESRPSHYQTPELADTPEEPLFSVKNAVQAMVDVVVALETDDHMSLESFAQYGNHRHPLTIPDGGETLAEALQAIPATLNGLQAAHSSSVTNIGAGLAKAIETLDTDNPDTLARSTAAKVVILLTDGKPNVNEWNQYVGNNHPDAISWAEDQAQLAKEMGMIVYSIGVGADVNAELCEGIASVPENYFFADNTPDPEHDGRPMYVTQLEQIFETLGGKRPVRLIQ